MNFIIHGIIPFITLILLNINIYKKVRFRTDKIPKIQSLCDALLLKSLLPHSFCFLSFQVRQFQLSQDSCSRGSVQQWEIRLTQISIAIFVGKKEKSESFCISTIIPHSFIVHLIQLHQSEMFAFRLSRDKVLQMSTKVLVPLFQCLFCVTQSSGSQTSGSGRKRETIR